MLRIKESLSTTSPKHTTSPVYDGLSIPSLAFQTISPIVSQPSQSPQASDQLPSTTQPWPGQGRRTLRDDIGSHNHKRKRPTSNHMPEESSPPAKRLAQNASAIPLSRSVNACVPDLDWRTRSPSRSQSRKGSPTRAQLQELRAADPPLSLVDQFHKELPHRVLQSINEIRDGWKDGRIPSKLRVSAIYHPHLSMMHYN